jgi:Tfp pilus assembly protein PilN
MLKKLSFENSIKSKIATGVEIVLLPDGAIDINVVVLKRNKSILSSEKQLQNISNFSELAKNIDAKLPIVLIVNGKGIIHRKVSYSDNDTPTTLLNKVLPNANVNEFYIQQETINTSQTFVSVVRASVINDLIAEFEKNNLPNIVGCLLGPFVVNTLLPLIDTNIITNELLTFSNYQLQIRENKISDVLISDVNFNTNEIHVGDKPVPSKLLIAFGAALFYFIGNDKGISNSQLIDNIKEEYKQKQKFYFLGWTLLVTTLSILIINYLVFNHYWTKNNELNTQLVLNQSALQKYNALKIDFSQKKDFLEQNGLLENSKTSYYVDQLAASLPNSIQWTDVNFYPLKKKEADDETNSFLFENKIIRITGNCNHNTELNDWMKDIKKKSWITSVELLNYKQDDAKEDGLFLIEIKLN